MTDATSDQISKAINFINNMHPVERRAILDDIKKSEPGLIESVLEKIREAMVIKSKPALDATSDETREKDIRDEHRLVCSEFEWSEVDLLLNLLDKERAEVSDLKRVLNLQEEVHNNELEALSRERQAAKVLEDALVEICDNRNPCDFYDFVYPKSMDALKLAKQIREGLK